MNATLALINLCIQVALIVAALAGLYLAKRRRLKRHCLTMRTSMGLQILAVIFVMAPSLAGYVNSWRGWSWFVAEIIVHHTLGVLVIGFWIYFNLALAGVVKAPQRLRPYMRAALIMWLVSLALGIHLYLHIWR
jgi:hypothetical protein